MSKAEALLRSLIGLAILAIVVRTFIAIGWIQPVVVSGGSMVPSFIGESLLACCGGCKNQWAIDPAATDADACPECGGKPSVKGAVRPARIDATRLNKPEVVTRWEVVLLRSPEDSRRLLLKRILGKPGERVSFSQGDLWIDGRRITKSLDEQRRLSVPVATHKVGWQNELGIWSYTRPITDSLSYNSHVSRRLNNVSDRMIEIEVTTSGEGGLVVVPGWPKDLEVRVEWSNPPTQYEAMVLNQGRLLHMAEWSGKDRLSLVVSTFDRTLLIASDSSTVLQASLPVDDFSSAKAVTTHVSRGGKLEGLRLFRDVYYESLSDSQHWKLSDNEWFVVGDNQSISRDSRNWSVSAGVPGRLLVGLVSE